MSANWAFRANDNDGMGWAITVAYLVVAILCFICSRRIGALPGNTPLRQRGLWWSVGTVVLLLGVNKQLDLQTPLRDLGRALAEAKGWYQYRRMVQTWFVVALGGMAVGTLVVAAIKMRRTWRHHGLLYVGMVILAGFVVMRAASFHHVKSFEKGVPCGHDLRAIVELTGLAFIGLSAWLTLRRIRDQNKRIHTTVK